MDKLDVWNIAMHIAALPHCHIAKLTEWSRQESNLNPGLRRPLYYPLYYETIPCPAGAAKVPLSLRFRKSTGQATSPDQPAHVRRKDLHGDRQQHHPEELPHRQQPRRTQHPGNEI